MARGPDRQSICALWCEPFTRRKIMEQKGSHSKRILKSGSISFDRSKADCKIRSISAYGAALDIVGDGKIPDEFALTVIPDGDLRRCAGLSDSVCASVPGS